MFVASLKNENKNEINYIFLDNNNYIGFSVNENGLGNFDYDLFNRFINGIKLNNKCIKISKYDDYDVYYNPITKYNHYIKDGKEDFVMFYLKNGTDALLYEHEKNKKHNFYSILKKIVIGTTVVVGSTTLYLYINSTPTLNIKNYNSYNKNDSSFEYVLNYENISVDEFIEKINNSSNLTDTEKEILSNKQLLSDLKPYYDNSYMRQLINLKLNNIQINFFRQSGSNKDTLGYYNPFNLNQINLCEDYKNEEVDGDLKNNKYCTLAHEYIHLLQSNGKYDYINEAVAEIMAEEYYGASDTTYYHANKNIKFLIEIIGPEPILEYSFGGNYKNLENILADNLSFEKYKKLLELFSKKPHELSIVDDYDMNIIFLDLYQKIYKKNIHDDNEILFEYIYSYNTESLSSRSYLNKSKILEEDKIVITYSKEDIDNLLKYNLINYVEKKKIKKESILEEYINNPNVDIELISSDIEKKGNKLYYKNEHIGLDEAYEKGYIKFWEFKTINKSDSIDEGWILEENIQYYETRNKDLRFLSTEDNLFHFIYFGKGLSSKFDINYNLEKNKNVHM